MSMQLNIKVRVFRSFRQSSTGSRLDSQLSIRFIDVPYCRLLEAAVIFDAPTMAIHRSFIAWLLLVGLVGVYAQRYEEVSTNDLQLDESSSAPNLANEDSVSIEDLITQEHEARIYKRSDPKPSTSGMSEQDFEWHVTEGAKTLKRLSVNTAIEKEAAIWKKRREEDAAAKEALRQLERRGRGPKTNKRTQPKPTSSSRRS